MKPAHKKTAIAVGSLLAMVIAISFYLAVFLPRCTLSESETFISGDGSYQSFVRWRQCEKNTASRASVYLGRISNGETIIALEFWPPEQEVEIKWQGQRLLIILPEGASFRKFGPYDDWPTVQVSADESVGESHQ
jgi:hypothetical protein